MSTKIYTAYRIPQSKLIPFIDTVHDQWMALTVSYVVALMNKWKLSENGHKSMAQMLGDKLNDEAIRQRTERRFIFDEIMELTREVSRKGYNDILNLDAGLNIWFYGKHAYIIPLGNEKMISELKLPKWVKDYSYWNNTDRPEGLTDKEWDTRGSTWEKINCGPYGGKQGHNARRLYHSIVEFSSNAYVSITELQLAIFPSER